MASSSHDDIARVSGPDSMAKPPAHGSNSQQHTERAASSSANPNNAPSEAGSKPKKKRPRGGKNRRKNRRQSFAAPSESNADTEELERPTLLDVPRGSATQSSFYRSKAGNRSNTSLESEALLDHREHGSAKSRRQSVQQGFTRPSMPFARHRGSQVSTQGGGGGPKVSRLSRAPEMPISEDEDEVATSDRTPLLSANKKSKSKPDLSRNNSAVNYGSYGSHGRPRRMSKGSTTSSKKRPEPSARSRHQTTVEDDSDEYDVNNPPSVPGSPKLGNLDDVMIAELTNNQRGRDAVITIDDGFDDHDRRYSSASGDGARRRPTVADLAERDVCFPADAGLSEIGEGDDEHHSDHGSTRRRRKRARQWPDLEVLEDFAREEKEERTYQDHVRVKKISEPVMVGGRLRPGKTAWHREEDDAPFRYTYFNELLDGTIGTIHARTISDLLQDGATFRDLFIPDPIELDESSEDEDDEDVARVHHPSHPPNGVHGRLGTAGGHHSSRAPSETPSVMTEKRSPSASNANTGSNTPADINETGTPRLVRDKKFGAAPTFWLDILKPTAEEMKAIARAFGIHQLTTEDIMMEEEREKVELFQNYYFVNYRSFEQDTASEDYMEPLNVYIVVFRSGVITFHNAMTPHPANVRRRIRQLNDYMSPTADWISYAIIDDVTDVYAPLVSEIEQEVDNIDDDILYMHQSPADQAYREAQEQEQEQKRRSKNSKNQSSSSEKDGVSPTTQGDMGAIKAEGDKTAGDSGGDMLRRVGECRKKVMGLYRLLGNKADVIKGFAKRCNEHWEVAPRSEIGLYLGDIQDHIVTMTGNLSHYENLLSRAHSNYLAQINIRMNERAEQTADVLGRLTVLGTIVLPMNIITGMWGMNVWVPGQDMEGNLTWFWCITAGLMAFGLSCYFIAKKVYGIV
ncbi:hypothetical protein LTR36_000794 [Oleoguttula mirabilis]|uniref:Uncharacterized protein n=1 Tax=Oleoguttula mirabilis TaxID=1507867 RepID=A0AAV9J3M7_9PEZI|nr:hypothetical protein LTR36_000794 [Oleoguttula mirabilis]